MCPQIVSQMETQLREKQSTKIYRTQEKTKIETAKLQLRRLQADVNAEGVKLRDIQKQGERQNIETQMEDQNPSEKKEDENKFIQLGVTL